MPATIVSQLYLPASASIDKQLVSLRDQISAGQPCLIWREDGILLWVTFDPERSLQDETWLVALSAALDGWYAERLDRKEPPALPSHLDRRLDLSRMQRFTSILERSMRCLSLQETVLRLQTALWHVVNNSGQVGWQALMRYCAALDEKDRSAR